MPVWQQQAIAGCVLGAFICTVVATLLPWATMYLFFGAVDVRVGITGCFSKVCDIAQNVGQHFGGPEGGGGTLPPGLPPGAQAGARGRESFTNASIAAWVCIAAGLMGIASSLHNSLVGRPLLECWRPSRVDAFAAACLAGAAIAYAAITDSAVSQLDGHYDAGLWIMLLAAVLQGLAAFARHVDEEDARSYGRSSRSWLGVEPDQDVPVGGYMALHHREGAGDDREPGRAPSPTRHL